MRGPWSTFSRTGSTLLLLAVLGFASLLAKASFAQQSSTTSSKQSHSNNAAKSRDRANDDAEHKPTSFGGELAEQTRESTGEEEENSNLKHSPVVQMLARKTGMSTHAAHLTALGFNFVVIVIIILWAARKFLPAIFRRRTEAIQQALAEARTASQDANRRLAEIENRLRQLDVEIGKMQASADKEANAEEERIRTATEDDIKKVVQNAEQEIANAAKQVRRELSAHTAELAISLARKQISVDSNTDQVLVRNFASHLGSPGSNETNKNDNGGKGGH